MPPTTPPISAVLPPLIFGTATFNYQYTTDPFKLPTTALVHKALSDGVCAFDTSPYYGPAEEILGKFLVQQISSAALTPHHQARRSTRPTKIRMHHFPVSATTLLRKLDV
jgi:diketogulonate reductase-like aldo/keto reductase